MWPKKTHITLPHFMVTTSLLLNVSPVHISQMMRDISMVLRALVARHTCSACPVEDRAAWGQMSQGLLEGSMSRFFARMTKLHLYDGIVSSLADLTAKRRKLAQKEKRLLAAS
jgi:hypothetical protein